MNISKKSVSASTKLLDYLVVLAYLLIWGVITCNIMFHQFTDNDYLVIVVKVYTFFMGLSKIFACCYCLVLLCGSEFAPIKCLAWLSIFFAKVIDAVPTVVYMYKGLFMSDPMAFLFMFPKILDTVALWVITASDGVDTPCCFCFKHNKQLEDADQDETIELKPY